MSASRLWLTMAAFGCLFLVIVGRLLVLGLTEPEPNLAYRTAQDAVAAARPDLIDRNGEILATDITTASLFAEPRNIRYVDDAMDALVSVFPDLDNDAIRRRLESEAGFVWLKRELTPKQRQKVHRLGIPGVGFIAEKQRFYPGGSVASHIVGHVNVDNQGIAGVEKYVDDQGLAVLHEFGLSRSGDLPPVKLAADLRVQHVVNDELARAIERYSAIAAIGIVLNVNTGEVVAMSSLPDYNPNNPAEALEPDRLNRAAAGVYEMGSIFKTFTTAMALDSGKVTMEDKFDARRPIRVSSFTINDFHGKNRILTVPEIYIYSSNIGTAKMALAVGVDGHREFMKRIGLSERMHTELPETARPLNPPKWNDLASMTISFGHGISVTPLQTAVSAAALMNGGLLISPTFFPRSEADAKQHARQVIDPQTSEMMRYLFRLNVLKGSGRRAAVPGYRVGGKTGTAEKVVNGRYSRAKRFNSFLSAFPMDDPQYLVLVVIDEPKPEREGVGATAAMNAAPTVANIIRRSAPMLGVSPKFDDKSTILVSY